MSEREIADVSVAGSEEIVENFGGAADRSDKILETKRKGQSGPASSGK